MAYGLPRQSQMLDRLTTGGLRSRLLLLVLLTLAGVLAASTVANVQTLLLLIGTAVSIVAVNRTARTLILTPVAALVSAVARVRAGDLTVRVEPSRGSEIKDLSESFNLTADALERSRDLEERLRHAQQLQAIGLLAGGVAHEFNNMLTVILFHTEALLESDPLRREYTAIRDAAERSRILTHQLLAFSRRQVLQPVRVRLNDLVRRALEGLDGLLDSGIIVDLHLTPDDPDVFIDRVQFEHVMLNVLLNAKDAMPDGGRLTISTTPVTVAEGSVEGLSGGIYVELAVADTGCDMDGETLSRALEPFFTTKPFGRGTGLGLPTAYGIVRQSGGQLTLTSRRGEGTTVRTYLPAAERDRKGA